MKRILSPVIYYGGKSMLAPWIASHFPAHRVYAELFGGSASVLLAKERSKVEVYNDIWDLVTNFFRVARDQGEELKKMLWLTPFAREEYVNVISTEWPEDPIERARRFLVLSRQTFGGCGTTGHTYNPGRWKRPSIHESKNSASCWRNAVDGRMDLLIDRLQGVAIENNDFQIILDKFDSKETLFYADPPYINTTRSRPGHQYMFDFGFEDHKRLANALNKIKGKVIVSHYDHECLKELFPGWHREERDHFKCAGQPVKGKRNKSTEVLLMNFEPEGVE